MLLISIGICMLEVSSKYNQIVNFLSLRSTVKTTLLHFDSNQVVKWATVLFPPDIDDIFYCSLHLWKANLNEGAY